MNLLKQWYLNQTANEWLVISAIFKVSLFLSLLIILAMVLNSAKKNDWYFFKENLLLVGLFLFMFNMFGNFLSELHFMEGFDNANMMLPWSNQEYRLKLYGRSFYILKPEQAPKYEYLKKNISNRNCETIVFK